MVQTKPLRYSGVFPFGLSYAQSLQYNEIILYLQFVGLAFPPLT